MEKSESLSELLNSEENINVKRKCSKRLIKCIGIILFCSFQWVFLFMPELVIIII